MLDFIRNIFKKNEIDTIDVSSLVENGVMSLTYNYNYEQFSKLCELAKNQNIEFDRILMSQSCYLGMFEEQIVNLATPLPNRLRPFTRDGLQSLEGLKNIHTGEIIKIYTVRPREFLTVN